MDAKNKAEVRATFFQVIPLMLVAGGFVYTLKYCVEEYLGVHISGFLYAILATVLIVQINNKYIKRARDKK